MKNIAIVPARSGSKRLKNKNLKKILDLELFLWTLRAAKSSNKINKIIFSTDSENYIKICRNDNEKKNYKCEIDFRSKEEAGDKIKIFDYKSSEIFLNKNKITAEDR